MKTLPLSDAKTKLSRVVDDIVRRDERVTITKNGTPAAVMLSAEDYESLNATLEILSDPEFAADVRRGRQSLKRGKGLTLDQVFGPEKLAPMARAEIELRTDAPTSPR